MRRTLIVFGVSTLLMGAGAASASAASTRAEYIAQVDPICQSFEGPVDGAWAAYVRNDKRWARASKYGASKAIVRTAKRTARSLAGWAQTLTRLIDQVAPVPPPAEDALTVSTWLDLRRQANANEMSAASALKRGNAPKYFRLLRPADAEADASERAISGFGFQACGRVTRSR